MAVGPEFGLDLARDLKSLAGPEWEGPEARIGALDDLVHINTLKNTHIELTPEEMDREA